MRSLKLFALPLALVMGMSLAAPASAATKKTEAANTTTASTIKAKATTASTAKAPRSPAQLANDQKMRDCGAKWRGLGAADKAKYEAKGKTMKSKSGKPLTGWIAYSNECRKA
jgi:hypothetical protein